MNRVDAEFEAQINISDGEMIEGNLPKKPLRLVQAWGGTTS